MKKIFYTAALLFAASMFISCEDEKIIEESKLPALSKQFLKTHFNGTATTHIIKDIDGFNRSYTVYLENGFEIDFSRKGDWDEVEGHLKAVPQSILDLLPAGILQYVNQTYPDMEITKVNKESYGYDIGLNNDIEIEFNSSGKFIKFDD
ncbi:MAG: PepSY-like domain-containing protein [Bacteroidales bacterium]|jgi:hypothetical protein|nr:PepSY-like domain-containing protein [Bacteroidales bacterium]